MNTKIGILFVFLAHHLCLYAPSASSALRLLEGKTNLIHVAIIGSGPAGLAAAINPIRSGYHTIVFEGFKPGGELINAMIVENVPGLKKESGIQVMHALEQQVKEFGVPLIPQEVTSVDFSQWPFPLMLTDGTTAHALTVIVATGASQKKLGIEGEETYFGKGIFTCGVCDSSFAQGKDVVIVGGNDIAIQRALQLAPLAKTITFIIPGSRMTATKSMQHKLKGIETIRYLFNKTLRKVEGDGTRVSHAELYDTKKRTSSTLITDSIFLSTELTPNTELFKDQLPLEDNGSIKLREDHSQRTPIDGVMAAGCVADPVYRQAAVALGDGTKAGMDALAYLSSWGFDGASKKHITQNLYIPPIIPNIPHIKTVRELRRALQRTSLPLIVEFYSPFCPSCRKMEGPLQAICKKYKNLIKILKVDKDKGPNLVEKQDITMIPAFIFFNKGKEIQRLEGETTPEHLSSFVKGALLTASKPGGVETLKKPRLPQKNRSKKNSSR